MQFYAMILLKMRLQKNMDIQIFNFDTNILAFCSFFSAAEVDDGINDDKY